MSYSVSNFLTKSSFSRYTNFVNRKSSYFDHFFPNKITKVLRPERLDFSFCRPARMVFFSNWNKNITKKILWNILLEAKIWLMLSFRNNRRNIMCFLRSAEVVDKEYILTYGYSCSLLGVPSLRSKWKRILDFIYICKAFVGLFYTLRYIRSHLRRAWNIIYKFIYTSLTYENKTTLLLRNSRKI